MTTVLYDNPVDDRRAAFQRARQAMIEAYRDWLVVAPNASEAAHECDMTDKLLCRVRQAANLRGLSA